MLVETGDLRDIADVVRTVRFCSSFGSGKVACVPGWRWDHPVSFIDFDLWYVVSGEGTMTLQGTAYAVSPGSLIVMRPGDRPVARQNENDRLTIIFAHFHINGATDCCLLPPRHTKFDKRSEVEWMLHRILEADERGDSLAEVRFDAWMRLLLLELFANAEQTEPNGLNPDQKAAMQRAERYVRACCGQTTVHEVAAELELSPAYLARLFKRHASISLKEYLVRIKLEQARLLLTESSMSPTQVALSLHYADVYVFSKLFRKYYGLPPTQYVRAFRLSRG
ncbi:helix-turn-helix domain-containing protein [Paenibacillus cymbidii]|uniref:helix-turn-helix domain-containing protein n=1 Tax=Paenibacillus cymbidii TaxID=1639034 RepID=UPI001080BFD7|nr:AraC family transcriptional regulator [Paenibacillus cymbidii]